MRKERWIRRVDIAMIIACGMFVAFLLLFVGCFIVMAAACCVSDHGLILEYGDLALLWELCALASYVVFSVLCGYSDKLEKSLEKLPDPLEEAIYADCGETLDEAMEYLRDQRLEYRVACRANGGILASGTLLNRRLCNISKEGWRKVRGYGSDWVNLHNHPGLSESLFSKQDLKNFVENTHEIEDIVVTSHYTYRLRKTTKNVSDRVKEFKQYLETLPDFGSLYEKIGGRKKHAVLIQQIADRYGFEFTIESLRRDAAKKWFAKNQRRLCVAASCAILAFGIFCNPVTIPPDAATAASTKDIICVDPDYTTDKVPDVSNDYISSDKIGLTDPIDGGANEPACGHVDPPID